MTRALDPEVTETIWAPIEPNLPPPDRSHPLGCHNPPIPDKICFRGILIRLVTGSSWVDIEAILNFEVSDTTLRNRRDDWINAGVFDQLATTVLIVGRLLDYRNRWSPLNQHVAIYPARLLRTERTFVRFLVELGCR